jgi:tetratricopeptide (TPR) repeat protein
MARRTKAHAFEHNQLGVTFFQSGAIELAIEQFMKATRRAWWVPSYWLNLGVALLDKGELDEAESALMRAIALNPRSQSACFHLAQLNKKRCDEGAVRRAYEKTIELRPHTYLAQRREYLEGWRPRIITGIANKSSG